MSKLTKAQAKAHRQACELLSKDVLTYDEKLFVIENWQESATHVNSAAGAFFTPLELAWSFSVEVCGPRIIDLCAGIGTLAFACWDKFNWGSERPDITCVEINPDYVAVGRKILPEATWIEASVFDVPALGLGRFTVSVWRRVRGRTKRTASIWGDELKQAMEAGQ